MSFAQRKQLGLVKHQPWLLGFAVTTALFLLTGGCREPSVADRPSPSAARKAPATKFDGEAGAKTATKSEGLTTSAETYDHLDIAIDAPTEWTVGDEVSIQLTLSNHSDHTIEGTELRAEIQFGLQDSISEGHIVVPIASLPGKTSYHSMANFVSSRPGIWYVKAAVYLQGELIKATTRTLYIREATGREEPKPADDTDESLGPPLVDHPERLQRLHPDFPIWIDAEGHALVMIGRVCQREVPLELFACLKNSKEHESIVSINTRAYIVHAGLLALGVEPGRPVQFYPQYRPAEGPEIDIVVAWKDAAGNIHRMPAQQWVRHAQTKEPLELSWIFTGSQIVKDEDTGDQYYYADSTGELICVSNFPSAVLDLPIRSTDSNESLLFEAFTENIPPLGTPVTLILSPKSSTTSPTSGKPSSENVSPPPESSETAPAPSQPSGDEPAG